MSRFRIGAGLIACLWAGLVQANSCYSLEQLTWLLGSWKAQQGETQITETWTQVSTHTFEGLGVTQKGEQQSTETLRLVQMGDEIFYLAKVAHNPLPIAFRLTECGSVSARFENPDHDFPNQIHYQLTGATLIATVTDSEGKGFSLSFTP